ncbi:uncharacterized protein isoform X2 [Macaca fascicularis]|uniref:uncharacterized protein isoform X2 n=1 Tax=Macaca fascicularis TaxID=9541 RepID=UPI001E256608|nr:uncharacterized protein LOC102124190 isoform X3 [Macaca fascicularis]
MHIDSQVIMNLAFSKTRTDDITHVRTPWLLGDAIPFTRPSCGPASQAKARGARDWQPGRRTGRRKRKRREKDEMHLLLPGEARGSRNTEDEEALVYSKDPALQLTVPAARLRQDTASFLKPQPHSETTSAQGFILPSVCRAVLDSVFT